MTLGKIGLFLAVFAGAQSASADDYFTEVIRNPAPEQQISSLTFKQPNPLVKMRTNNDGVPFGYVQMEGSFAKPDYNLLWGNRKINRTTDGRFIIEVPLIGELTTLQMFAVGPLGKVEKEDIQIKMNDWKTFSESLRVQSPGAKFKFIPGLNFSYISYSESGRDTFSEIALTGKASLSYAFSKRWSTMGSFYITLLPLSSTTRDLPRFLGLNFRIGYKLPFVSDPWDLTLLAGYYFTTMFVPSGNYGFQNMSGPQLYPVLRKNNPSGSSAYGYVKFSPVSNQLSLLRMSNREMAFGAGMSFPPNSKGGAYGVTFDAAFVNLFFPESDVTISTYSISLGASYAF
ncbi:hypothetical protein K2X30_15745 [bacterium]|nr:hypothetical protein [bacterium]